MDKKSRPIKASEFKAKGQKPIDDAAPLRNRPSTFFGRDRDRIRILGDIIKPVDIDSRPTDSPMA